MTIINPTVGRIVWYWPPENENIQPQAAIVTYVHNDRLININAFTHNGTPVARTSIELVQEGDPKPENNFAQWMPYQIGQAKKHAD